MKDKTLLKIAVIISLLGLLALFFLQKSAHIPEMDISLIEQAEDDMKIKVKGRIDSVKHNGKITNIVVSQPIYVKVIVFDNISLEKGNLVRVEGSVRSFRGEKELIADKVSLEDDT